MGVVCWFYIVGLYGYESFSNEAVSDQFRLAWVGVFSLASVFLFYIAWWHATHPATYEATITKERFFVNYPDVPEWSFDISVSDIKRLEYRNTLSPAGKGIMQRGVLLKDGTFHRITLNYGINLNKMHRALQSINPNIAFPSKVNMKVSGPLFAKDYDD